MSKMSNWKDILKYNEEDYRKLGGIERFQSLDMDHYQAEFDEAMDLIQGELADPLIQNLPEGIIPSELKRYETRIYSKQDIQKVHELIDLAIKRGDEKYGDEARNNPESDWLKITDLLEVLQTDLRDVMKRIYFRKK